MSRQNLDRKLASSFANVLDAQGIVAIPRVR